MGNLPSANGRRYFHKRISEGVKQAVKESAVWLRRMDKGKAPLFTAVVSSDTVQMTTTVFQPVGVCAGKTWKDESKFFW